MTNYDFEGEKPSQIKTIANTLFTQSSTEKFANRLYLRIGQWYNKELIMIPLIGHITNIDTAKEFGIQNNNMTSIRR